MPRQVREKRRALFPEEVGGIDRWDWAGQEPAGQDILILLGKRNGSFYGGTKFCFD
jgi:hypothetical protein